MKLISLVSSGIDSPVSTFLMSKKADEILLVNVDTQPFSDKKETAKFIKLAKHLKKICTCPIKAVVVSHGKNLAEFKKKSDNKFTCVFCKRMMLRYAEKIAEKNNYDAVITGDNLGQVASQTLQNINTIEQAVKIPVLRPLIGFDKEDVIKKAKEIETYDLSILPSSGCSAVPNKPSTQAKLDKIIQEESKINIDDLVEIAVKSLEHIKM
jgi:tRNA uracil 4-sulfurtransferase